MRTSRLHLGQFSAVFAVLCFRANAGQNSWRKKSPGRIGGASSRTVAHTKNVISESRQAVGTKGRRVEDGGRTDASKQASKRLSSQAFRGTKETRLVTGAYGPRWAVALGSNSACSITFPRKQTPLVQSYFHTRIEGEKASCWDVRIKDRQDKEIGDT